MSSSPLPDEFVVTYSDPLKRYRTTVMRTDDGWVAETTVGAPIIGDLIRHAPRPIDADHARHLYDEYDVVG